METMYSTVLYNPSKYKTPHTYEDKDGTALLYQKNSNRFLIPFSYKLTIRHDY